MAEIIPVSLARISGENAAIILSNLADNAKRHGSTLLKIFAVRQQASLVVTVGDNGEGISPNNRAQVFDSFFTTRREHGSTGSMGLAIVRAILEAHGGTIRLIGSDVDATFELTNPIADSALS
jgi:signal transduction histidine kinase